MKILAGGIFYHYLPCLFLLLLFTSCGNAVVIFCCWPAIILMMQSVFGTKVRGQSFGQLQPVRYKIKTVQNGEPKRGAKFQ